MTNPIFDELNSKSEGAIAHLKDKFAKIQTGRASTGLVEDIMVDSFGAKMPLKAMATISIPEPKQIAIQPWSKDQITNVEKAIMEADLGLNPQNDGSFIRLNLPPLTEERRKDLVKMVHQSAEESKISVRNARHEAINYLKQLEKEKEISEDELRGDEKKVQEKVDEFNSHIEEMAKHKEEDVMTV